MSTVFWLGLFVALLPGIGPGRMAVAQTFCTFTPTAEGAMLYYAPLTDPAQQKSPLVLGQSYLIQRQNGEHFYVTLDGLTGGWVDRRSGILNGECGNIPVDNTPLSDFPTVCVLSSTNAIPFYGDSALSQARNSLAAGTYVVVQRTENAYYVRLDHAFGGWVPSSAGTVNGDCARVPPVTALTARTLDNARVWSIPNVKIGTVLAELAEESTVIIVAGPVTGPIRYDTNTEGDWYQVAYSELMTGWVWAARLDFADPPAPPPPALPTAITRPNARLWTQPDVKNGSILVFLPTGLRVDVLAGPVAGPIRYDTADWGDWYYVQPEGGFLPGWIWAQRLAEE